VHCGGLSLVSVHIRAAGCGLSLIEMAEGGNRYRQLKNSGIWGLFSVHATKGVSACMLQLFDNNSRSTGNNVEYDESLC
jgi:hypothetical protein